LPGIQRYLMQCRRVRYGKFGYLDLLDAQRSLSESKRQYIESLAAYRKAYADVGETDRLRSGNNGSAIIKPPRPLPPGERVVVFPRP